MTVRSEAVVVPLEPPGLTEPDEFDLDLSWGELDPHGGVELYLPTGQEVPNETCDSHNPTCPHTCHATCPATCQGTCPDTCRATCQATCRATCPATCRATCHATCQDTCEATCRPTCEFCQTNAGTHCFTCRSGCQTP
jgi:hypothetical protein